MKHTLSLMAFRLVSYAALTLCCLSSGCDEAPPPPPEVKEALPPSGPKSELQSPNARILPEPLSEPPKSPSAEVEPSDEPEPETPRVRPRPRRFPISTPLPGDDLSGTHGGGYVLSARFVWPEAERRVSHHKLEYVMWPTMRIELSKELRNRPARVRWVVESPVFSVPQGSELRARADRLGAIVVWPDQRSYRVVPEGALRSMFEERRVDNMPFVEPRVSVMGSGQRLGRVTERTKIETPLGVAHLETVELSDLPYAGPLFCRQLMELLRVHGRVGICEMSKLPLRLFVEWHGGGQMLLEVTKLTKVQDLLLGDFRIPPPLPIFKRGELPPFEPEVFRREVRDALLPYKKAGEELAPEPPAVPTVEGAEPQAPDPTSLLPADVVLVRNDTLRPLLVSISKIPALWIFPGQQKRLRLRPGPFSLGARDFLGELVIDQGIIAAPATVHLAEAAHSPPTSTD